MSQKTVNMAAKRNTGHNILITYVLCLYTSLNKI